VSVSVLRWGDSGRWAKSKKPVILNVIHHRHHHPSVHAQITCLHGYKIVLSLTYLLTYSVTLVRKRTMPTERPPLVGEVSANFCG
jgi:hypothetical protein